MASLCKCILLFWEMKLHSMKLITVCGVVNLCLPFKWWKDLSVWSDNQKPYQIAVSGGVYLQFFQEITQIVGCWEFLWLLRISRNTFLISFRMSIGSLKSHIFLPCMTFSAINCNVKFTLFFSVILCRHCWMLAITDCRNAYEPASHNFLR